MARILSIIFHPLLLPTYLFFLFSKVWPAGLDPLPSASHNVFLILIFIVTFAVPALLLWVLSTFRVMGSLEMKTREERVMPFFSIAVMYLAITYMFFWKSRIGLNDNFMRIMLIIDMLVIVSAVATIFYKISIHSLAIWGNIGILIALNKITELNTLFIPALVVVVLAGLIMSARVQLGAHSLKEVMWGAIIGLATSVAGMQILL